MGRYLLRVEGQNLDGFVFDTQDLSTARGGSLALLDLARRTDELLPEAALAPISTGGSIGVWRLEAPDDDAARAVADGLAERLGTGRRGGRRGDPTTPLAHATAAIGLARESGDLAKDLAALQAAARRAQMASVGQTYPVEQGATVCPVDLKRPVSPAEIRYKGTRQAVSAATHARRGFGLDRKQSLYRDFTRLARTADQAAGGWWSDVQDVDAHPFAMLMSSISESAAPPKGLREALHDKIAVIMLDGTGFGTLEKRFIADSEHGATAADRLAAFDGMLQRRRAELLLAILDLLHGASPPGKGAPSPDETDVRDELRADGREAVRPSPVIRMEMLLWGGDELMFVVPARLGWEALERIIETTRGWAIPSLVHGDMPMHHGIGLVFCHHDAPIARIRRLADDLAEHAKSIDRTRTMAMAMALESFDHVGDDLEGWIKNRAPGKRRDYFVMDAAAPAALRRAAQALNAAMDAPPDETGRDFSRRRLRALARALHGDPKRLQALADKTITIEAGGLGFGRSVALLEEFWDYLLPLREEVET